MEAGPGILSKGEGMKRGRTIRNTTQDIAKAMKVKREENMVAKEWEDAELYNLETTDFNSSTMLEYVMDDERLEELSNL